MAEVHSLGELELVARESLTRMAYDYIAGGSDDEWTLSENRAAFHRLQLIPRVLVGVCERRLSTTVLGSPVSLPVLVAPMAFQALAHAEGELATARAAATAGTVMIASTLSNYTLEAIAGTGDATRWFQLYVYRDRGITRALVERAVAASYKALCVTVDAPLIARRPRDMRNEFTLPPDLQIANFHEKMLAGLNETGRESGLASYVASQWDAGLTWKDIDWLCSLSSLPLVLKGIMSPDDARLAVEHGAKAIVVSNHGGRQLDTVPATITMLPRIVDAVEQSIEVLVDGGIRRGTDVLKALALGARAVLLGRPILWGLAAGGEEGVRTAIELLRAEIDIALALTGCTSIDDVLPALIHQMPIDWQ